LIRSISSLQVTKKKRMKNREEGYKDLPEMKEGVVIMAGDDESIGRSGRYVSSLLKLG